jgi:predicted DNA-binding protein with PD1-like motif
MIPTPSYKNNCQPVLMMTYTFRLHPGQDLNSELNKFIADRKIKAASIITAVGSLEKASLRFANQPVFTPLPESYYEIVSLVGILGSGGSHIHGAFSDKEGKTYGGHRL